MALSLGYDIALNLGYDIALSLDMIRFLVRCRSGV